MGNVIHALVNNSAHVPYRDSKITKILQDSLGGKTKTYIFATVSPTINNADETISTLKFADRAHSVFCRVEPNEISLGVEGNRNLIKKLTTELSELKEVLKFRNKNLLYEPYKKELTRLRVENDEFKRYVMNNDPLKRLIDENKLLRSEIIKISKSTPWTQLTTSYLHKEKEHINTNNMRYVPFANVGNDIIYGSDNMKTNNNSNNDSKLYTRDKEKERYSSEIEGISKSITKAKSNLRRLDEMEKENQLKTQKLIDEILKKTKRKDI